MRVKIPGDSFTQKLLQAPARTSIPCFPAGYRAVSFDSITVLGTTIDEAFDKVAKFYGLRYPGRETVKPFPCPGSTNLIKRGRITVTIFPIRD